MRKVYTRFQTETAQKPYPYGTYRIGLCKGSIPSGVLNYLRTVLLFWGASITFCSTAWTSSLNTSTIRQFILRNISIVKNRWIHRQHLSPAGYCFSLSSYEDKTVIAWRLLYDMKRTWLKKTSGDMQWSGAHYDALAFRFSPFRLRFSNALGEVLLGILGGGMPPGSPNPDPISDQKM